MKEHWKMTDQQWGKEGGSSKKSQPKGKIQGTKTTAVVLELKVKMRTSGIKKCGSAKGEAGCRKKKNWQDGEGAVESNPSSSGENYPSPKKDERKR